jgi:Rieske Fe-S protein
VTVQIPDLQREMMMDRRGFMKICAGSAAALAMGVPRVWAEDFRDFSRTLLTDSNGTPLKATALGTEEAYIFHYPYKGVPCFLINLGKPAAASLTLSGDPLSADKGSYTWPGGVGKTSNLVAYVAICTHQLSAPNKEISYLRYAASGSELAGAPGKIVCCAHGTIFEPSKGAEHVSGPATYPLVPVRLEYNPDNDSLAATAIAGHHLIDQYFKSYKRDLIKEYGPGVYRENVGANAVTQLLSEYSASIPMC